MGSYSKDTKLQFATQQHCSVAGFVSAGCVGRTGWADALVYEGKEHSKVEDIIMSGVR